MSERKAEGPGHTPQPEVRDRRPPAVEVVFDYVDPGSYLVSQAVDRWQSERPDRGARVEWRPLELRPPGSEPVDTGAPDWGAMHEAMAEEAEALGLPFAPPAGSLPRSRKAHELALHAAESGCFDIVHRALFRARYAQGLDLGRIDVLVGLAEAAGMDPAEVRTVLGVDRFRGDVESVRRQLLGEGVRGVPTVRIPGGEVLVEGYPGWEAVLEAMNTLDNRGV
jgi:predicted DsbA family dithiol-disulfide isomerase